MVSMVLQAYQMDLEDLEYRHVAHWLLYHHVEDSLMRGPLMHYSDCTG